MEKKSIPFETSQEAPYEDGSGDPDTVITFIYEGKKFEVVQQAPSQGNPGLIGVYVEE